jgi:hypothetical protein
MSILEEATRSLRSIESELLASSQDGPVDVARIAEQIKRVIEMLSVEDAQWIGSTEAKRLLGLGSENTVKAWARLGLLRSRTLANGRVQVLLDDVLNRRIESEDLAALEGDELSPDELHALRETRPGMTPWQRGGTGPSQ